MFQIWIMKESIPYFSISDGLLGVSVLISSFHDDDGKKYIYNLEHTNLAK